jgi:hypothetical protein
LIGLAELLALAGVAHRLGQRGARHAEAHGAGDDADLAEGLAQVALAVAFFPGQAMAVGDEAFVEGDFGGRQRPDAHLVDFATDGDALELLLDEEDGELLLLAGPGENGEESRPPAPR